MPGLGIGDNAPALLISVSFQISPIAMQSVQPNKSKRLNIGPIIWVCASLALLYLVIAWLRPQEVFWSLDEGGKYLYIQNVLRIGDPAAPLRYPGKALDPQNKFVPLFFYASDGAEIYSWWPVGFPLLTLPLYSLLGWIGLYIWPALGGVLISLFGGLAAVYLTKGDVIAGMVAAAIIGIATPVFFYSTLFWEHTPSVALLMAALYAVTRFEISLERRWALLIGVLGSLAAFFRTEQVSLVAGTLLVFIIQYRRRSLDAVLAFVLTSIFWFAGNNLIMGLGLSRQWGSSGDQIVTGLFGGVREAGWWFFPQVLFNTEKIIAFDPGPWVLSAGTIFVILALLLPILDRWRLLLYLSYVGLAAISFWVLLQPYGYRSVHGFVLVAPHVVYASWMFSERKKLQQSILPTAMFVGTAIFLLLFTVRSWEAAGGQQWGPRYLLGFYPLAVVASVSAIAAQPRLARSLYLSAAYLLLVSVGLGFEIRGQSAILSTKTFYVQSAAALDDRITSPTLTDCTWLPMVIPKLYWEGRIFAQTTHSVEEWISYLHEQGIEESQFLTADMCLNEPLDYISSLREQNPSGITLERLR